jgi:hypothetical protein
MRSEKREARSEKREARSEKREARSEKREARSENERETKTENKKRKTKTYHFGPRSGLLTLGGNAEIRLRIPSGFTYSLKGSARMRSSKCSGSLVEKSFGKRC